MRVKQIKQQEKYLSVWEKTLLFFLSAGKRGEKGDQGEMGRGHPGMPGPPGIPGNTLILSSPLLFRSLGITDPETLEFSAWKPGTWPS